TETLSAPPSRMGVPWQEVLLSVSLFTFWNLSTTAQLTIESVPANANLQAYYWYKSEEVICSIHTKPEHAYSGRQTIYPNGSLLFQKVTQYDTGFYILQTVSKDFNYEDVFVELHVFTKLPKPFITSTNYNPGEDEDSVALTCEPETPDTTYLWWINGHSLPDRDRLELSKCNRTLTLPRVTRNDTGNYECGTWNPVSINQSDPVTLNVLCDFILFVLDGLDTPTISPAVSYFHPGANLSLSCHAASNPAAQFFNGRPQSSTQELFIPNVTANNGGSYTHLVHNSVTGLSRTTVNNIPVFEKCILET
uniref:Ig-like domain-containing protein n=1 Tax=Castor canadensis TaxID=51338 RepID=A0A8C0W9T2_CASCN